MFVFVEVICLVASDFLWMRYLSVITGLQCTLWSYKKAPNHATSNVAASLTSTSMASYYPLPSSPFSGAGRNTAPDPYQRPSPGLIDKLQAYPPDGYTSAPPAASPLQPYAVQPARVPGRSYSPRPESPAQTGRPASGWLPQTSESLTSVPKIHKTFLQWKAEAQATTADYQRNGFPSPVAWVPLGLFLPSFAIYALCRYTSRATPSPRMPLSGEWTAGDRGILPGRFTKLVFISICDLNFTLAFRFPRARLVSLMHYSMVHCNGLIS